MNYNEKLESLAKEFDATVNHAVEVMEQYIATAVEKEVMDAINRLSPEEKEMLLVFTMLDELMQSQPEPEPEKDDIFTLLNKDDICAMFYKEAMEQMKQEQLMQKQITEEMLKHLFG
jgi:hypothetical protein